MNRTNNPTKRSPKKSSQNNFNLIRWQLAASLKDRMEMLSGSSDSQTLFRLAAHSRSVLDLIRRYSNDSML